MPLKIRLARGGAKKRPHYSIVIADARSPRDGRFVEKIGTFDPLLPRDHADRVKLDADRVQHWLSHGAQPTDRVLRFLDVAGLATRPARSNPKKGEPGDKAKERAAERAEKAAAPPSKAEAPVEAPIETPVEAPAEAPVEAPAEAPVEAAAEAPAEAAGEPTAEPAAETPAVEAEASEEAAAPTE